MSDTLPRNADRVRRLAPGGARGPNRPRAWTVLAGFVLRHPAKVVGFWVILLLISAALASGLNNRLENGGYTPPGSQSDQATKLGQRFFGNYSVPAAYLAVIAARPSPALLSDAGVARLAISDALGVEAVGRPTLSPDRRAALLPVTIAGNFGKGQTYVPDIDAALAHARLSTSKAYLVGETPTTYRMGVQSQKSLQIASLISFPATLVVLLIAFLSLSAALLPLGLAAMSVGVTFGLLYLLSYAIHLSVFVEDTVLVLGLGLSIDFSLFMVTRAREVLARNPDDVAAAIIEVVSTTGRAITISGLTIITALSGLYVVGVGIFSSLATGAIGATLLATSAALTLVPAMLALIGDRLERFPVRMAFNAAASGAFWPKLADFVVRRRVPVILVAVTVLLVMSIPLIGIRTAFPTIGVLPHSDPIVVANRLVIQHFGPDAGAPATALARTSPERMEAALSQDQGVVRLDPPRLGKHGWIQIAATLRYAPDSPAAARTVRRIRVSLRRTLGPTAVVAGSTALGVDLIDRINQRTAAVVIVVLLLDMLILSLVFGAPLIALKAALTTLLSVMAALGVMNLIFRSNTNGITYFVPLFLFTIVFGLSTDYEVFLLSRIREYSRSGVGNVEAVKRGLIRSARSITLAGTAMSIVFLSFAVSPLKPFKELGLAMGLAIFLDVTLVRVLLVPATVALLGEWNWWRPGQPLPARESRNAPPSP